MEADAKGDQALADARLAKAWSSARLNGPAGPDGNGHASPPPADRAAAATQAAAANMMPATQEELEAYGQRVLRPGVVQSHGVCLLLSRDANPRSPGAAPVLAASANAGALLGITAEALLGADLLAEGGAAVLSAESAAALRGALASADLSVCNPLPVTLARPSAGAAAVFDGVLHRTSEGVVLDLEAAGGGAAGGGGALRAHALARASVARLQALHPAAGTQPLCQAMVDEVRALTGYERVLAYQFHEDQHGEVVAESVAPGLAKPSWLGMHFPSTDIPQANRALFLQVRSRLIADADAAPVAMLQAAELARPAQLGASQLRGITGCHAQYLRSMGVAGSLVLALITHTPGPLPRRSDGVEGASGAPAAAEAKLWGLCVCHSYTKPLFVPYAVRSAAEFLLQVFALQLGSALDAAARARSDRIIAVEASLCDALTRAPGGGLTDALAAVAACTSPGLADLTDASGAAAVLGGASWSAGGAPPEEELLQLAAWVETRPEAVTGCYNTDSLAADGYPRAAAVRAWAAGLLAVRLTPPVAVGGGPSPPPGSEAASASAASASASAALQRRLSGVRSAASVASLEPDAARRRSGDRGESERCASLASGSYARLDYESSVNGNGVHAGEPGPPQAWVLWFRREVLREVRWAGDRAAPQGRLAGAAMLPRTSFAASVERTELSALPWRPAEVAAAVALRALLLDAAPAAGAGGRDGSPGGREAPSGALATRLLARLNVERSRALSELQSVASELTEVVRAANVPMLALDSSGRLTEWNNLLETLTGRARYAVLGTPLAAMLLPRCAAAAADAFAQAAGGAPCQNLELSFALATPAPGIGDGDDEDAVLTVAFNVARRRRAAAGVDGGLVLVGHDVSAQRRLAARCARVTHDLSLLVDHAAAPVFGTDAVGVVNAWNAAMARATGLEPDEALGGALTGHVFGAEGRLRLASEEQRVALEVALQAALRGAQSPGPVALTCALRDGRELELVLSIDPRRGADGDDTVRGTFCFAQDVGLRKALQHATAVRAAAEAATQAKNRQLAMLCHELRNPLNGILGTVAALDDESTDPAVAELVSTTLTCSNQLRRTIDQMLDMAKMEEGKLVLALQPFSVRAAVRDVLAQIQRAAREKGLHVVADLRGAMPPAPSCFVGDAGRVQQILANFAWNSVKFVNEGSITIRVDSEPAPPLTPGGPPAARVFFRVIDTGCGMDADQQARLFQPYEMAAPTRIGKYGGSGLGLTICQALAKLLGGTVHCVSSPGVGTTFVLQLTMEIAADMDGDGTCDGSGDEGAHAWEVPDAPSPNTWSRLNSPLPQRGHPHGGAERHHAAPATRLEAALARAAAVAAAAAPWQMRVVREVIDDAEVAVLAELSAAGHVRQAWGAAPRAIGSSIGVVLNAATAEAFTAAAALFDSPALAPFGHSAAPRGGAFGEAQHPPVPPPTFVGSGAPPMPSMAAQPPRPLSGGRGPVGGSTDRFAGAGGSPPRVSGSFAGVWPSGSTLGVAGIAPPAAQRRSVGSRPASPGGAVPSSAPPAPSPVAPLSLSRPPSGSGAPGVLMRRGSSTASLSTLGTGTMSRSASSALLERVPSAGALPPGQLRRVLAVDDEPVNLALVRRFLERDGVEVVLGEDGHDLVDIMVKRGERFDIVLLDEHMRRMNGSPAAVLLRNYEAEHGLPPTAILATTGNASAHDVRMYASSGFDGLIVKPLNMSELARSLREYMAVRKDMPGVGCAGAVWVQTDPERVQLRLDDTRHFGAIQVFGPP